MTYSGAQPLARPGLGCGCSPAVQWAAPRLQRVSFPATRMRRLRQTGVLRDMVRETELSTSRLVYPLFIQLGERARTPIEAMPGIDRVSISEAVEEAGEAHGLGIPAILLFGLPAEKDDQGSGASNDEGVSHPPFG